MELSAQIKKMEAERDRVVMEAEAKKTDKAGQEQAKVTFPLIVGC